MCWQDALNFLAFVKRSSLRSNGNAANGNAVYTAGLALEIIEHSLKQAGAFAVFDLRGHVSGLL